MRIGILFGIFMSFAANAQTYRLHLQRGLNQEQEVVLFQKERGGERQIFFYGNEKLFATEDGRVLLVGGQQLPNHFVEVGLWHGEIETTESFLKLDFYMSADFALVGNPKVTLGIHDTIMLKGPGRRMLYTKIPPKLLFPIKPTDELYRELLAGGRIKLETRSLGYRNEAQMNRTFVEGGSDYKIHTTGGKLLGRIYSVDSGETIGLRQQSASLRFPQVVNGQVIITYIELEVMVRPGVFKNVRFEIARESSRLDYVVFGGLGRRTFGYVYLYATVADNEITHLNLEMHSRLPTDHNYEKGQTSVVPVSSMLCEATWTK